MRKTTVLITTLLLQGCFSNEGIYKGIQNGNINQCYKLPPSERDDCLDRNSKPYEEFKRQREKSFD